MHKGNKLESSIKARWGSTIDFPEFERLRYNK